MKPVSEIRKLFEEVVVDPTIDPMVSMQLSDAYWADNTPEANRLIDNFIRAMPNTEHHQRLAEKAESLKV